MSQLDSYVMTLKENFDTGTKSKVSPEANALHSKISRAKAKGLMDVVAKLVKQYQHIRSTNFEDESFKKLTYVRYADD